MSEKHYVVYCDGNLLCYFPEKDKDKYPKYFELNTRYVVKLLVEESNEQVVGR